MIDNLQKIDVANIFTSPFPHLVIDNFLEQNAIEKLHNELRNNLSVEKAKKLVLPPKKYRRTTQDSLELLI